MELISFVIPCYNSEKTIEFVVNEISKKMSEMKEYNYEIILVNDYSKDRLKEVALDIIESDKRVRLISFTKNFGQHSAVLAGMKYSRGKYIICLDDDGQDNASELDRLIKKCKEGYDVVCAKYPNKKQNLVRKIGSSMNEYMATKLINKPKWFVLSSYFIIKRNIVEEMLKYENAYPYLPGLFFRVTTNVANIDVERRDRMSGESNYSFRSLLKLWFNGFTAFSVAPLRFATFVGIITALMGFMYIIYIIFKKLVFGASLVGWSSLMSVMLFIGGIQMLLLGLIGEYIGRIYIVLNKSPQYVIQESFNMNVD